MRAPVNSLSAADSVHGVRTIAPFKRERAATICESEISETGSIFIGRFLANKKP
jgi:hypothetical protein